MSTVDYLTPAELDAQTANPGLRVELATTPRDVDERYRTKLLEFTRTLLEQRGYPQHLAVLFNALRYGYDPDEGGYHLPLFADTMFDDIWAQEISDAVPVGAFVHVLTTNRIDRIPAEVVHKEGRHPDVTPTHVPDDLPGRVAQDDDAGRIVVREALVVDPDAFTGHPDPAALTAALARIRTDGRDLDARGHYVGDLAYRSVDDAEMGDIDYFTRWLARREKTRLLAELVDTDDIGTARTVLQQILRSLRAIVDDDPSLYLWRGYVYSKDRYDARTDDESADSVYGAPELRRLWRGIAARPRVGAGAGAPDRVALHPLTSRLLELYGYDTTSSVDDVEPAVAAHIDGTAWVATVVHAHVFLSREADVDSTDDGLVASTLRRDGVGAHARVDDTWQHASIWRTERFDMPLPDPPPTLLAQPVDEPLGLGAWPWADDQPVDDTDDGGKPQPPADETDFLSATYTTWVVPLAPTRLDGGTLPVPADVAERWRAGRPMTLRLEHLGERTVHSVTYDATRRLLVGLDWPSKMIVAAKIRCQVATGGSMIVAYTFPLGEPYIIDVDGIPFRVTVAVDEAMLRRWLADAPATPAGHSTRSSRPGIADALIGLLAVRGDTTAEGGRRLDLDTLTRLVFPDVDPTPRLCSLVLRAAHQAGFTVTGDDIHWMPGAGAGVNVNIDLAQLAAAGDRRAAQAVASMRPHRVRMHLRRLTVSERAAPQRRRSYQQVREQAGAYHLPPQLPDGYTYVTAHETN